MSTPEILEEVTEQFTAWKEEILRLLGAENSRPEVITGMVGGYTYAQIVAIIDEELLAHVNNRNAHGLTLAQFGGMPTSTFDTLMKSYYPKAGMPFTVIKAVPVSVAGNVLKVMDFQMMHMGRNMATVGVTFPITTTARQYIKVVVTGPQTLRQATIIISPNANEDINTIIIGHVALVNGVVTPVFADVTRIGHAAISQTRRGYAIPATGGTPTQPQSLPASWFS